MAGTRDERWYFAPEVLENSPSRKNAIDADKELSYRQQSANMIQDMGQRLQVTQLCINTAIVYMHRFYVFHSFSKYHRASIAACALFLAAKVEEQPRKLEHVIKIAHLIQHQKLSQLDVAAEAAKLVKNENVMLQTLGFDIAIEHPHTFVVKCCQMVRATKDLAQTCYFMATNSLHLTTMCLKYKPTVVACVCIHLACKWSSWQIPQSSEGKSWWNYVDADVSVEKLEELTKEFLTILDKCPSRLKRKIMSGGGQGSGCDTLPPHTGSESTNNSSQSADGKPESDPQPSSFRSAQSCSSSSAPKPDACVPSAASEAPSRTSPGRSHPPAAKEKQSYSVYKEKKEQEKREQERKEAERLEADRKRAEADRAERERRLEAERRVAAEQQREQERLDRERREQEVQRRELEQREAERRAEAERREKERREAEKRDAEKKEAERREQERIKAEQLAAERREAERLAEQERREAERREAELRQREAELREQEEQRLKEERRRREEAEQQEAARVHEDQVRREAEKRNRFFPSRTATAVVPDAVDSYDDVAANSRGDEPADDRPDDGQVKSESPHKHHKSDKSHKRKKSKHKEKHKERDKDRDKERSRDKRHDKHEAETVKPIKLKIKPVQPEPEPVAETFKIRIARDRLLNHSSTSATADPDSSRKRKNSFEAASISKKPVV